MEEKVVKEKAKIPNFVTPIHAPNGRTLEANNALLFRYYSP
jgi:hypothetical protein